MGYGNTNQYEDRTQKQSIEVQYGMGQMGSAFQNLNKPVYPPAGKVITAIQFLEEDIVLEELVAANNDMGYQFPATTSVEAQDVNFSGVTTAACTGARTTKYITNDTVTISAANSLIKVGQSVLLVHDGGAALDIDNGLTLDAAAGHIDPIYFGHDRKGFEVKFINGVNITIGPIGSVVGTTYTVLNPDANNTLVFLDTHHGAGGTNVVNVKFPKGITITGRWSKVLPPACGDGGIICYFGE